MLFYNGEFLLPFLREETQRRDIYLEIYENIKDAKQYYPSFEQWYFLKVLPELAKSDRTIIYEKESNRLKGVAILKPSENKLCHLSVMPEYRNKGIGVRLFKKSFEELGTSLPYCTVSEEKLPEFKRLFDYFGFKLTNTVEGYYRIGKKEYFFNEFNKKGIA